jgi:hypothetical protein
LPTIKASPPAKTAPTIQENIIGKPKPPRKPVDAGFVDSIASIPGAAVTLIAIIPPTIIPIIEYVLI